MFIQVIPLEKEASDILSLVRRLRNSSTPAGRLPPDILVQAMMQASERDILRASHVCRSWQDALTSSPRLWTTFTCKAEAQTLQYLTRSEHFLINATVDSSSFEMKAAIALRSAADRLRSLNLKLGPSKAFEILVKLDKPTPALKHLRISVVPTDKDPMAGRGFVIPATFLGGSTPTLQSLHLHKINTRLNFPNLSGLIYLTFDTSLGAFNMSELFQILTSTTLLEVLTIKFSGPLTSIPVNQGTILLQRLKKLRLSSKLVKFPERLLSLLKMPLVKEINLDLWLPEEDTRILQDFLPSRRNLPHTVKLDTLELHLRDGVCNFQSRGPSIVVWVHASCLKRSRRVIPWQSSWLRNLQPMWTSDVKNLTLSGDIPLDWHYYWCLFWTMTRVQSLFIEDCSNGRIMEAMTPSMGYRTLFQHLKHLQFLSTPYTTEIFPGLTKLAQKRCQEGTPLIKVSSDKYRAFPRSDVESLQPYVQDVRLNKRAD